MPQIDFYLNIEEKYNLVKFILDNKGFLIASLQYDEPRYDIIKNIADYSSFASENSMFFILHDSYMKYPLRFDYFEKGNKKKFFIMQRYGGPYIDFYSSGQIKGDFIGSGDIGHYPYFYNNDNRSFSPPVELLEFYRTIAKYIKSITLPYKRQKRKYFIGKTLIQEVITNKINLIDITKEDILSQFGEASFASP